MMRRWSSVVLSGLLVMSGPALAGKNKKKKNKGAEAATADAAPEIKPDVPGDKNSEQFAKTLIEITVEGVSPLNAGSGARFIYNQLTFAPNNTWEASGFVELMGEKMECTETGRWEMEPATSPKEATMVWTVEKTDCINQSNGDARRYLVTLDKGSLNVSYR